MSAPWQFWIDRGGTFTDCLGISPQGAVHTAKILSSDEAPLNAIRSLLAEATGADAPAAAEPSALRIRLGTTVATNALLERRGVPTGLVTNEGLSGVFEIGTQERPQLFELEIRRPPPLPSRVVEVAGRRNANGEAIAPLDLDRARRSLAPLRTAGIRSLAVVGLHAHRDPADERALAALARSLGFEHVVCSTELSRERGFLARGETAIADAYLTPLLQGHLEELRRALPGASIRCMQSSGGLTDVRRFRGPGALLSGPAGGVVATRAVARAAGFERAIGFDMGGTSTDVSLVGPGPLERAFETRVGGVRVQLPMLRIHTVAAGGGSLCRFDGTRLTVGPESAGSDPGPLCYAVRDEAGRPAAQELALTDVNVFLGRVVPDRFPLPLDVEAAGQGLERCAEALARAGFDRTPDEVAAGFFEIANASMAQAIAEVSVSRGADPRDHVLVGFGGAGGQHACAVARRLGITTILLHPYAGLLSALGIGLAPLSWDGERDAAAVKLASRGTLPPACAEAWDALEATGRAELAAAGADPRSLVVERTLDLGYVGSDTALAVLEPAPGAEADAWQAAFVDAHQQRFGYARSGRAVEIKAIRVRVEGGEGDPDAPSTSWRRSLASAEGPPHALRRTEAWFPELGRVEVDVVAREDLRAGHRLEGPVLVLETTGTVVVDPGFVLEVEADGTFRIEWHAAPRPEAAGALDEADPVRLEVLGNRFMSIAEQMGAVLRNTAVSTNIKERLDYSCAVFDGDGGLVANAPHIPVHLGAMADTVRAVRRRFPDLASGDVVVTNDPFEGGSHLPDVTVVTPVFLGAASAASFFVASRGHHADIGGRTPGSMPPDSTTLAEEGVLIEPFRMVEAGRFNEARVRAVLGAGPYPARRPDDNVADLEAMVAANRAGAGLLGELVAEVGETVVDVTMRQLQQASARKVRRALEAFAPGTHRFEDALDDGTPIVVLLDLAPAAAADSAAPGPCLRIDFAGSGPASPGNLNAPTAVVRAAVLYVLRSLVDERIPLNGGCLDPVALSIPPGSILDPPRGSAVVGGNVETSQRVVDVLLGALGRAAASQGTMNNVTFGDESFGYYETLGGGAGATPRAPGASAVHTHMTNTRITDPEVLEARYPVRLVEFAVRKGSGGAGARRGGDGLVRHYRFLTDVTVSLLTERRLRAPFGLAGGEPGVPGRNLLRRATGGDWVTLAGHVRVEIVAGDELRVETPGGGGHGTPEPSAAS